MASKIDKMKEAHQAFNKRDYGKILDMQAEGAIYHDRARDIDFHGRDEFKAFMTDWVKAFSDCKIENPTYLEAGDTVIAQFTSTGTNDGAYGQTPPTGKSVSVPMCEVAQFDDKGQLVSGDLYYNQLTLLLQLGLAEPRQQPSEAEEAAPLPH